MEEFQKESDRAAVIVGAAFLDEHLLDLLRGFLVADGEANRLLAPDGPLGSFGTRIRAAYCMGLISNDERNDLVLVQRIRNAFAHDLHGLSFDNERIKSRCLQLSAGAHTLGGELANSPRQRFVTGVVILAQRVVCAT